MASVLCRIVVILSTPPLSLCVGVAVGCEILSLGEYPNFAIVQSPQLSVYVRTLGRRSSAVFSVDP